MLFSENQIENVISEFLSCVGYMQIWYLSMCRLLHLAPLLEFLFRKNTETGLLMEDAVALWMWLQVMMETDWATIWMQLQVVVATTLLLHSCTGWFPFLLIFCSGEIMASSSSFFNFSHRKNLCSGGGPFVLSTCIHVVC